MDHSRLIIAAIIAYNEEGIIAESIKNLLAQNLPDGYRRKIFIVTNGCTDKTEEIVREIEKQTPEVKLVSYKQKGKAYSLGRFASELPAYLGDEFADGNRIVIFLDADVYMPSGDVLYALFRRLKSRKHLDAVIPTWVPACWYDSDTSLVANIYRVLFRLQKKMKGDHFRGMCYAIRLDTLRKITFPRYLLNEDQFLEYKLRGRYELARDIEIVYRLPTTVFEELRRRQRHAIALEQIRELYRKGALEQVYGGEKDDPVTSKSETRKTIISTFREFGARERCYLGLILFIRMFCGLRAKRKYRKFKRSREMQTGLWRTDR